MKLRNARGPRPHGRRAKAEALERVVCTEGKQVLVFVIQVCVHLLLKVWIVIQELLEPQSRDVLDLLFENLVDWVSSALEDVDQVHYLFLSKLEVVNLIIKLLAPIRKLNILLHQDV